ncbi:MAG: DUF4157 domain-containing protein [Bacteroidota bacterium]
MRAFAKSSYSTPGTSPAHLFFQKKAEENQWLLSKNESASFFPSTTIQPKLKEDQPKSKHDSKAKALANSMVEKAKEKEEATSEKTECPQCQQEEQISKKEIQQDGTAIMRKPAIQSNGAIPKENEDKNNLELESQLKSTKGKGQPLEKNTKAEMESGFGASFENVRVHNDATAVQMNEQLGARAFANGSDIYFNKNEYNTSSQSGKKLIAHELTHTIQQSPEVNQEVADTREIRTSATENSIQRIPQAAALPALAPIVIPLGPILLILAIIALIAVAAFIAYRILMAAIADLVDAVETVSEAIENHIENHPRNGMRCSTELIAFRAAKDAVLEALGSPASHGVIIIIRRLDAFKDAANALASCLGIPPFF